MAQKFNALPHSIPGKPDPFTLRVSEQELSDFRTLLSLSKVGPSTWWNQHKDCQFGVSREWLSKAKDTWLTTFDWRKHEERINSFPNFKIAIKDPEAGEIDVHFAALFSTKEDAIPIIFLHGWPGSFIEFLPMMQLLADKYAPESLPYHVIVPSLPDYGISGGSSKNIEMDLDQAARIMNQLMIELGFGKGYIAQGGDVGSMLARIMSVQYRECKAFHLNMLSLNRGETAPPAKDATPAELQLLERVNTWRKTGMAYALEHGTRPATIGLVLSSSPLALLPWVGEKFLDWVDHRHPLPLDTILAMASLYWFTSACPRSLYPYLAIVKNIGGSLLPVSKEKPFGYSLFPYEIGVLPKTWAEHIYPNMVFFKHHTLGGHFACLEQPKAFLEDIEEFVQTVSGLFKVE